METPTPLSKKIRGVLIDLSGTLHIGNDEIPGAKKALKKLRAGGLSLRFLTNTSTKSVRKLLEHLNNSDNSDAPNRLGFGISSEEMVTSVQATADYVRNQNLTPLLLLEDVSDFGVPFSENDNSTTHPSGCIAKKKNPTIYNSNPTVAAETTESLRDDLPFDSVVVGLAPSSFGYEKLNKAFRVLLKHPQNLIAVHNGKYLRDTDGELSLGPGAFIHALEVASQCEPARVMGKPSREIFESAMHSLNRCSARQESAVKIENDSRSGADGSSYISETIQPDEVCMIGDDVWVDCQGALEAGIGRAILVQTGKYRPGDEDRWQAERDSSDKPLSSGRFLVRPSIVEAIELVLELAG